MSSTLVDRANRLFDRIPDTPGFFAKTFNQPWKTFTLFLLVSWSLRIATFGDPNLHVDEAFYFLVGQRMHEGALPYVDVWDRKPLGLFLIYYLIAGISKSIIAYQIVALIFAAATALVISLICERWTGRQGAILAGLLYLAELATFQGFGGQAPVFYNLFVATGALLLLRSLPDLASGTAGLQSLAAMLLCGIAITIKQTTVFESAFFGLFAMFVLLQSGAPARRIALAIFCCAIAGAAPTLLISVFYLFDGHWHEYWQAMVTSNFVKSPAPPQSIFWRCVTMLLQLYPIIGLVILSRNKEHPDNERRNFVYFWILFAIFGLCCVPNFYRHYALPLLVPLCIASSPFLNRRDFGAIALVLASLYTLIWVNPFDFQQSLKSRESMVVMAEAIRRHDRGGGLLVFDGPPYLYAMTGSPFLSPLVFPHHLNHGIEKNVSHLTTSNEVTRILASKPGAVVFSVFPRNNPVNKDSRNRVKAYVQNNCQLVSVNIAYEVGREDLIAIYGDCDTTGAPDLVL